MGIFGFLGLERRQESNYREFEYCLCYGESPFAPELDWRTTKQVNRLMRKYGIMLNCCYDGDAFIAKATTREEADTRINDFLTGLSREVVFTAFDKNFRIFPRKTLEIIAQA